MSSANRLRGRRSFVRPKIYLTLLPIVALCVAGPCAVGLRRVVASDGASSLSRVASVYRHSAVMRAVQNQNGNANSSSANSNAAPAANANGNTNAATTTNANSGQTQGGGGASSFPVPTICRDVNLGPAQRSARDLVTDFKDTPGLTAKALTDRVLLLCGTPRTVDTFKGIAQRLTGGAPDRTVNETHYVRLFYLRKAGEIADAINRSGRLSAPVKAVGDDLLVFPSDSIADNEAIHEFRRWVSVVDMPRPEISLMTWSVQISSGSPDTINRESVRIRSAVSGFNDRLQSALEQGWWLLESSRRMYGHNFYAKNLSNYLSNRYLWTRDGAYDTAPGRAPQPPCWSGFASSQNASRPLWGADKYCLGYTRIFSPIQPSLTGMLLALVAAQPGGYDETRMRELRNSFVDCLENRKNCGERSNTASQTPANEGDTLLAQETPRPQPARGYMQAERRPEMEVEVEYAGLRAAELAAMAEPCEELDNLHLRKLEKKSTDEAQTKRQQQREKDKQAGKKSDERAADGTEDRPRPGPAFNCFREQLHRSLGSGHLGQTRRALADFLYQYKSAEYYPRDFVAWNQAASAQALDAALDPLIVAFNRDLNVYLRHIQDDVQFRHRSEKKATFESDGIVTARVISSNTAKIETTTQSFFKQPPTLNVRDVVTALTTAPTPTLAPVASGTGAELIASAIRAEQRMVARVGRHLNLEVTSNTLKGASACEMHVSLDSVEADKPSMLNTVGAGTPADDNLSRVAKHTTNTKVRVDSTKLFEVSSFAAALVRGRSIPLIPPGVDLPYIGSIARLRLPPGTVYHRSFAIVSAVIVPTAADLANVIEFSEDLEELPSSSRDVQLLAHAVAMPTPTPEPQQTSRRKRGGRVERKGTAPATPPATKPVYYWIVTHYRDGDSISGPFLVSGAPATIDDKHTVTLLWNAPERALSFDVIRTTSSNSDFDQATDKKLLIENTTRFAYVDNNAAGLRSYNGSPALRAAFSRITRPAGNLRAFHKAMLDCIEDEARGDATNRCADAYLSKQPTEGRGQ